MTATFSRRQALVGMSSAATLAAFPTFARAPDRATRLARGVNIPDLVPMRATQAPDPRTLQHLRIRGMTHVRLPVHAERVLPHFSNSATIARTLDDLDHALDSLLALGFAISVDMHPSTGLTQLYRHDPHAGFEALTAGWRILAARLRRRPVERVFAELLNEPPTTDDVWRRQAESLVARLRDALPDTTMIVGPAPYQRVEALASWIPLPDANVVYAFHYYDPMAFTHQGENWDPTSPFAQISGVPFPIRPHDPRIVELRDSLPGALSAAAVTELERTLSRPWTERTIGRAFAPLAAWSRLHSVPVVLNEFGVLRFKAAPDDRAAWIGAVRRQAERHGFGWAHWEYSHGFGLLDENGRLDRKIVDALLPRHGKGG